MKRCSLCNAVYDDSYGTCPTCGVRLNSLTEGADRLVNSNVTVHNVPLNNGNRQNAQSTSIQFYERSGSTHIFNGALAEVSTQQYYQSKSTKLIRALFSGEPYQLSHTSYITILRIEEHALRRYPEQAQDVVLFGGVQNVFAPGDDLTIRAKRKRNRYVAKRIFSHSIDRNIRIEGNIPAGVIRFLFLILVAAIIWAIHGIASIDYLAFGNFGRIIRMSDVICLLCLPLQFHCHCDNLLFVMNFRLLQKAGIEGTLGQNGHKKTIVKPSADLHPQKGCGTAWRQTMENGFKLFYNAVR